MAASAQAPSLCLGPLPLEIDRETRPVDFIKPFTPRRASFSLSTFRSGPTLPRHLTRRALPNGSSRGGLEALISAFGPFRRPLSNFLSAAINVLVSFCWVRLQIGFSPSRRCSLSFHGTLYLFEPSSTAPWRTPPPPGRRVCRGGRGRRFWF